MSNRPLYVKDLDSRYFACENGKIIVLCPECETESGITAITQNPDGTFSYVDPVSGNTITIDPRQVTVTENPDGSVTIVDDFNNTVTFSETITGGTISTDSYGNKSVEIVHEDGSITAFCVPPCWTYEPVTNSENYQINCGWQRINISNNDVFCRNQNGTFSGTVIFNSVDNTDMIFTVEPSGDVLISPVDCTKPSVTNISYYIQCPDGTISNTSNAVFSYIPQATGVIFTNVEFSDLSGNEIAKAETGDSVLKNYTITNVADLSSPSLIDITTEIRMPLHLSYISHVASAGTFDNITGVWDLTGVVLAPSETISLIVTCEVTSAQGWEVDYTLIEADANDGAGGVTKDSSIDTLIEFKQNLSLSTTIDNSNLTNQRLLFTGRDCFNDVITDWSNFSITRRLYFADSQEDIDSSSQLVARNEQFRTSEYVEIIQTGSSLTFDWTNIPTISNVSDQSLFASYFTATNGELAYNKVSISTLLHGESGSLTDYYGTFGFARESVLGRVAKEGAEFVWNNFTIEDLNFCQAITNENTELYGTKGFVPIVSYAQIEGVDLDQSAEPPNNTTILTTHFSSLQELGMNGDLVTGVDFIDYTVAGVQYAGTEAFPYNGNNGLDKYGDDNFQRTNTGVSTGTFKARVEVINDNGHNVFSELPLDVEKHLYNLDTSDPVALKYDHPNLRFRSVLAGTNNTNRTRFLYTIQLAPTYPQTTYPSPTFDNLRVYNSENYEVIVTEPSGNTFTRTFRQFAYFPELIKINQPTRYEGKFDVISNQSIGVVSPQSPSGWDTPNGEVAEGETMRYQFWSYILKTW